jgi:hypothetical protein
MVFACQRPWPGKVSSTAEEELAALPWSRYNCCARPAVFCLPGFAQGRLSDIDVLEADAMFQQFEEGNYANVCPTLAQSGVFDTPTQGSPKKPVLCIPSAARNLLM